jgi:putative transposase
MQQLAHNSLIKIITPQGDKFYRVILDELLIGRTALVDISELSEDEREGRKLGGRRRKTSTTIHRKKPPLRNTANIEWLERCELVALHRRHLVMPVTLELERQYFFPVGNDRSKAEYERRCRLAAPLLNYTHFREEVLATGSFASLAREIITAGCGKALAYKLISLMSRFGFSETSLRDRRFRCGAPGKQRPCDPGGRKKPGRKTRDFKLAALLNQPLPPQQPGMSSTWRTKIIHVYQEIKKSKKMKLDDKQIAREIQNSGFVTCYKIVDGIPVEAKLEKGTYPNVRQIKRVLKHDIPEMEARRIKCSENYFQRNLRGLRGKMWHNIPGPGHTWAIDSTIGDMFLRSTLNRAWIIGRPVVYIVVDVWSTAVVGFHVCIQPPSWLMAQVALFNSAIGPAVINELFECSVTVSMTLNPLPSLPASLWMDNGEYKSEAGRAFGLHVPEEAFTPPYRPDWHGVVEVLHRITKQLTQVIPGSIDYRRKQLEEPNRRAKKWSVMTVPEFIRFLHCCFYRYNLTANRENRLDSSMKSVGVIGAPAGLWHFGHAMGIGTQRSFTQAELITQLLPQEEAKVTSRGVFAGGIDYGWPTAYEQAWSERARHGHRWSMLANYHPSTVRKIWTPDANKGLIDFTLPDDSNCENFATQFDYLEVSEYAKYKSADIEHYRTTVALGAVEHQNRMIADATALTREEEATYKGRKPTIPEVREIERQVQHQPAPAALPEASYTPGYDESAMSENIDLITQLLNRKNSEVDDE